MFLAPFVWGLTIATAILFATRIWWFPPAISSQALAFDAQFALTLAVTGAAFVLTQASLGLAIFRFRDRGRAARGFPGSARAEVAWTLVTAACFLGLAITGTRVFAGVHLAPAPAGALRVEVLARQFAWSFRLAGPDGSFGRVDLKLVDDAAGDPFGLDPNDAAGRDDRISGSLRIPVGRPVTLILRSRDVIHSFFVRELRIKQDAVPGMEIPLQIRADRMGVYEIACAELCGLGHHQMRSTLHVVSQQEFDAWLRREKK
jgi:cytochrome c oxidase subunit 2